METMNNYWTIDIIPEKKFVSLDDAKKHILGMDWNEYRTKLEGVGYTKIWHWNDDNCVSFVYAFGYYTRGKLFSRIHRVN